MFSLTSMEIEADEQATATADHSTSDGQIGSAADESCTGGPCTDAAPRGRGRFSTMRCDICHALVPADLFDDHRHICAAMQTDRPFTGGAPLPAVGRSSRSGSASSLTSSLTSRDRSVTPHDRSDARSPAHVGPKVSGHGAQTAADGSCAGGPCADESCMDAAAAVVERRDNVGWADSRWRSPPCHR